MRSRKDWGENPKTKNTCSWKMVGVIEIRLFRYAEALRGLAWSCKFQGLCYLLAGLSS